MKVTVNGQQKELKRGETVALLLETLGLDPARVAVERNRAIVIKDAFSTTLLDEGDVLEIVQFVGGG